jgi:hypothetical protein
MIEKRACFAIQTYSLMQKALIQRKNMEVKALFYTVSVRPIRPNTEKCGDNGGFNVYTEQYLFISSFFGYLRLRF